eukprot:scaffold24615_cov62-Attheya_sp.AAC.3
MVPLIQTWTRDRWDNSPEGAAGCSGDDRQQERRRHYTAYSVDNRYRDQFPNDTHCRMDNDR